MKTRRQWYEDELPADIAAMAIRNAEAYDESGSHQECLSLNSALAGGFIWIDTPQGKIFWEQVEQGNCGQIEYSKEANK